MKIQWLSDQQNQCTVLVNKTSTLVAFMQKDQSPKLRSNAFLIDSSDLEKIKTSPENFITLIQKKLGSQAKSFELRFFGNPKNFFSLSSVLSKLDLQVGKHVQLSENETKLLFLPLEGRVRREITSTQSNTISTLPSSKSNGLSARKKRVLVVDDSETIRKLLSRIISEDPDMECVGTIERPSLVEKAIEELKPDLVTLDIHMPEMDGVTLLKQLLKRFDLPMVMISSLSREEGTYVLDALEAGAIDYIQKPSMSELSQVAPLIREKIKNSIYAKVIATHHGNTKAVVFSGQIDTQNLVCIGSSTGGTEALKSVLTRLPAQIPPILIVQHIPAVFSKAFADRMNTLCPFEVREAKDGDLVKPGLVLVAPGGFQMRVKEYGAELKVIVEDAPPMNRHKPSVDFLFHSVAELKRKKLVAGILTGMGADGAKGLLALKNSGAATFAQNEESCVVYGMPKEANRLGAADKMVHLDLIPEEIISLVTQKLKKAG